MRVDNAYACFRLADITGRKWELTKNISNVPFVIAKGTVLVVGTFRHPVLSVEVEFDTTSALGLVSLVYTVSLLSANFVFEDAVVTAMEDAGWVEQ